MIEVELRRGKGRFNIEFTIANQADVIRAEAGDLPANRVRKPMLEGTVDTGAARLILPESVAAQLGLEPSEEVRVRYADGHTAKRKLVKNVWLEVLGRSSSFSAVLEPDRDTALIGAIVLEELDFLVDCTKQALYPRDPHYIVSEAE
jgi:predicted aspartyl protease